MDSPGEFRPRHTPPPPPVPIELTESKIIFTAEVQSRDALAVTKRFAKAFELAIDMVMDMGEDDVQSVISSAVIDGEKYDVEMEEHCSGCTCDDEEEIDD